LQQLRTYRKRKQNLTSQVRLREVRSHRKCRHQCGKKHRSGRACRVSPWRDGKGRLDEAGTLRSDSGSRLNAVGIPFLQGGEDVQIWTIDAEESIEQVFSEGASGVITNKCNEAIQIRNQLKKTGITI